MSTTKKPRMGAGGKQGWRGRRVARILFRGIRQKRCGTNYTLIKLTSWIHLYNALSTFQHVYCAGRNSKIPIHKRVKNRYSSADNGVGIWDWIPSLLLLSPISNLWIINVGNLEAYADSFPSEMRKSKYGMNKVKKVKKKIGSILNFSFSPSHIYLLVPQSSNPIPLVVVVVSVQ